MKHKQPLLNQQKRNSEEDKPNTNMFVLVLSHHYPRLRAVHFTIVVGYLAFTGAGDAKLEVVVLVETPVKTELVQLRVNLLKVRFKV